MRKILFALVAASLAFAAPGLADYVVKDGAGVTKTIIAIDSAGNIIPQSVPTDATGTAYGAANRLPASATQSGTWTVQPGNTPNSTAWLVTGTGGTFPATQSGTWNITNVSGTVSLPTGAATSALQTSLNGLVGEVQASPTANTLLDRLKSITTALGTPMQTTGGTVAATQSGTWNVNNIAGTVSLPTGAATAANQASEIAALGAIGDAAWTSGNGSIVSVLKNIAGGVGGAIPAGTNTIGSVRQVSEYPNTAVPYTASATGTTAATTATLTGAASVTTYICGFSIRANATAAATGNATVTGTITGTLNFTQWTAPNASGLGVTEMIFTPCVPASATNTSIAVVSAAPGTGGVVSVTAWGYKL